MLYNSNTLIADRPMRRETLSQMPDLIAAWFNRIGEWVTCRRFSKLLMPSSLNETSWQSDELHVWAVESHRDMLSPRCYQSDMQIIVATSMLLPAAWWCILITIWWLLTLRFNNAFSQLCRAAIASKQSITNQCLDTERVHIWRICNNRIEHAHDDFLMFAICHLQPAHHSSWQEVFETAL